MGENVFQINGGMINACKKRHVCEKDYVWNFLLIIVKMENI